MGPGIAAGVPVMQMVGIAGERSAAGRANGSRSGRNDASGSEKTERDGSLSVARGPRRGRASRHAAGRVVETAGTPMWGEANGGRVREAERYH
jgi:hypothetical protein